MATNQYAAGKANIKNCTLAGVNVLPWCQNIKVYESMCTPYIKSELTLIDNGVEGNAGLVVGIAEKTNLPGAPVTFAFDGGRKTYRRDEQIVLTVDAMPSEENKRVQVYTIGTIGVSYLDDRKSLVQKQFVNIPATVAAAAVHNEYLPSDGAGLNLKTASLGMIAKDSIGNHPVSNVHPFKAIEDLLRRATYGGAIANPTVYFRDAESFVMAPLQLIFATTSSNYTFIESAALGKEVGDIFLDKKNGGIPHGHGSIISAALIIKEDDLYGARNNVGQAAAALTQGLRIFDKAINKPAINKMASGTGLAGLASSVGGAIGTSGGIPNILNFNQLKNELSSDPGINKIASEAFLAKVKDADKYHVKVPIKHGINLTVGQGVTNHILAPAGAGREKQVGGLMLIADLMHDCYFDQRTLMGTTTMRAVKVSDVI